MRKYRKVSEMPKFETRSPVSARIRENLKLKLEKEAKKGKISLGELIEWILEDYVKWLGHKK